MATIDCSEVADRSAPPIKMTCTKSAARADPEQQNRRPASTGVDRQFRRQPWCDVGRLNPSAEASRHVWRVSRAA